MGEVGWLVGWLAGWLVVDEVIWHESKRVKVAINNALAAGAVAERSTLAVLSDLFKARLSLLVLLTTAVGFYLGSGANMDGWLLFHVLLGTGLLTAGAAALNQYLERDADALMVRTSQRPIPSGALQPTFVLRMGSLISVVGMLYLALIVNPLTGLLGALTLGVYLFVYTPLKRRTSLNTMIGAIPGALPPLMGWTGATGSMGAAGWALFTILFFWQLPHFMAIAWLYREDYQRGGFRMLPLQDPEGFRTGSCAVRHTLALMAFSLTPFVVGAVGSVYVFVALVLGSGFLWFAIRFSRQMSMERARHLFLASIIYLPLLLGALVADRVVPVGVGAVISKESVRASGLPHQALQAAPTVAVSVKSEARLSR